MQKRLVFLFILIPFLVYGQSHNKIEVVVLGSFHFGETPDFKGSDFNDVLTRKRQREIGTVVKKLADFNPDKIFVENTSEAQALWDQVYQDYLKRKTPKELSVLKNEIYQLGIRTAALSPKSEGVICINYSPESQKKNLLFGESAEQKWLNFSNEVSTKKPAYDLFFKSNSLASSTFEAVMAEHRKWQKLPLIEHLVHINSEESLKQLHYVNVLSWMDNNVNGVGAELSSIEYFRNLKIVQNLFSKLEASDNRVLVIFGAAHAKILRDLLESHPVFNLLDVKEILD